MSEKQYNTHLAAEFFVMSALHRLGANALLTVGNKKALDIVVEQGADTLTFEVKGLAAGNSFPLGDYSPRSRNKNHYFVFVSFGGNIANTACLPDVYIVPAIDLDGKGLVSKNKVNNVLCKTLEEHAAKYKDQWPAFAAGA